MNTIKTTLLLISCAVYCSAGDLTWTWIAGDPQVDVHGSKTDPGGRSGTTTFVQLDRTTIMMFGGERKQGKTPSVSNDLWMLNVSHKWTLLHAGSDGNKDDMPEPRQLAAGCGVKDFYFVVFGGLGTGEKVLGDTWVFLMHEKKWYKLEDMQRKMGVPRPVGGNTTSPPARGDAAVWCQDGQTLVVFGGFGADKNLLHDMWIFNLSKMTWTQSGSSSKLPTDTNFIKHLEDYPRGRSGATTWISSSKLYMYGGNVQHKNVPSKHLNIGNSGDIWLYDLSEDSWRYVHGSKGVCTKAGEFGVQNRPSAKNRPGCRRRASAWVDNRGNLWMFGGDGADVSQESMSVFQASKLLSDLWSFNVENEVWIWKGGLQAGDQVGKLGEKGKADDDNLPSSRCETMAWNSGNYFFLFGGIGHDVNGKGGYLNDIWMLNVDKDPSIFPNHISPGPLFGIIFLGLILVLGMFVINFFLKGRMTDNRSSSIESRARYSPLELAEQ